MYHILGGLFCLIFLFDFIVVMNKAELDGEWQHDVRLREENKILKAQLAQVETCLCAELTKLRQGVGQRFSSVEELVSAVAEELGQMATRAAEQGKASESQELRVRQLEFSLELMEERSRRAEHRCQEQEGLLGQAGARRREAEGELLEELRRLRVDHSAALAENQRLQKELELREIVRKQEGRVTISAAIHHTQQELQRTRLQCEQEFQVDCMALVAEMRQKDDMFRLALRKLHSGRLDEPQEQEDFGRVLAFIRDIASIEQLNAAVNRLKAETLNLKREDRERRAEQQEAQRRAKQLQEEIGRLTQAVEVQALELRDLREEVAMLRGQLERERAEQKQLEGYFSQKWLKEFEIVRANLERAFSSRLLKIKGDYEARLANQQSHSIKHQQAAQVITSLEGEIATLEGEITSLQEEVKTNQEIIVKLEGEKEEFRQEAVESHKLVAECRQSEGSRIEEVVREKDKEIEELRQQLSSAAKVKESYEQKLGKMKRKLREDFEGERKALEAKLAKEQQEMIKRRSIQAEEAAKKHQQELLKAKAKEDSLRQQYDTETSQLQAKHRRQLNEANKLVQQGRTALREAYGEAESKQKSLQAQIQQLRRSVSKQAEKLKKELEEKSSCIRTLQERSKHDETFKKQMRYLLDLKIKDCGQLSRQNERLSSELLEREAELVQLNNILLNNDWKEVIAELRAQFRADLFALNEIHWKQTQIYRSKVHELEGILYCKHAEDEQRLLSLTHHNEMLETRIEVMQRRKTEEGESPLPLSVNFVESRRNLLLTKRKRRGNFNFSQTIKNRQEGSTAAAIIRMKRFLERGKSTDAREPLLSPFRSRYNRQSTER